MTKKGFTLEEILIATVLVGVLAVLMMSAIKKVTPDKTKTMFKKAYSIAERTVAELVNDETLYPYDSARIGFLNTDSVTTPSGATASGNTKMCTLFVSKVNTMDTVTNSAALCSFTTTDGITWSFPQVFTYPAGLPAYKTITVDINGSEPPNSTSGAKQDRFSIIVQSDGKISVTGTKEIEYLKSHSLTKK